MAFTKITKNDTANKGVVGLPDTPGLSATEMQMKFDELALDVIIPKYNGLIDELEDTSGANTLGANVPSGIKAEPNVQSILNAIGGGQSALNTKDGASKVGAVVPFAVNQTVQGYLDALDNQAKTDKAELLEDIEDSNNELSIYKNDLRSKNGAMRVGAKPPKGIVSSADNVQEVLEEVYNACKGESGDMKKSVYDTQNRGFVDHAEYADKIADIDASNIQPKNDTRLETDSKDVVGAINELKRSSDIFDSTAMFYIDKNGHYCVDTLQAKEIIEFRIDENSHLNITVNV